MGLISTALKYIPRPLLIRLSYIVRPVVALALRGNRFTDPIDGKSYRKFLSYGYGKSRPNVLAPGTLSLERHRLLWLYLKNETDFFSQPQKVLHVAPEQAYLDRFRKLDHLDYTTTDLLSPIADIKADLTDLPFAENTYDMIICNHVLEHIPDDTAAMKEIFRVLKPGGQAILQVPYDRNRKTTFQDDSITDPKERAEIFGQYDHVRVYGMDYFKKLESIGFEIEAVDYTKNFSDEEIERYRLPKGELIPLVKKTPLNPLKGTF